MERQWAQLTPDEKKDSLWQRWLSPPGIKFASTETEAAYRGRVTRFKDAIELKKAPDRVPVFPVVGWFPAYYSKQTPYDMMYDPAKLAAAYKKYILDFSPDAHLGIMVAPPGKFLEALDYKLYAWPGHGVVPENGYQAIEGEYMTAAEYDDLIDDPTDYFLRVYFPRVFGALAPFRDLSPVTRILEIYGGFSAVNVLPFGLPHVQGALKALMEAGAETLKWIGTVGAFEGEMVSLGYPNFFGGGCKAPFDTIGDTLRGSKGIMMDMYRNQDKLLKAMDRLTPLMIKMGASACKQNGNPICFIPLHKGADGFMSDAQFKKFYWPGLRNVLLGLIEEGCVPFPWAEGGYNSRLEVIKDLPKGKTVWGFDATDMAKAKEVLGPVACIGGNVPISSLEVGTVDQVKGIVKTLIDTCARGGGYVVMTGATVDAAKAENLKAMVDAVKQYGRY